MRKIFLFFQQAGGSPSPQQFLESTNKTVYYYLFEYELFKIGERPVQTMDIIIFVAAFLVFIYLATLARRILVGRLLVKANFRAETTQLAGFVIQYSIILIGFIITLQIIGIDLTGLNVLAGAIGVALGFGLQTIANNFVSGLIIVLESPFRIGDRIEIGTITGKITEIGARSTKILADDETVHIIPNQKLVTDNVRNFNRPFDRLPHEFKVFVGYGNDAEKVLQLLQKVAENNPQVLAEPKPSARLKAFDVNKLDFVLNFWTSKDLKEFERFQSQINVEIYQELIKNGITSATPLTAEVNLLKQE
jgi:small-conductance mechanosensitive channel